MLLTDPLSTDKVTSSWAPIISENCHMPLISLIKMPKSYNITRRVYESLTSIMEGTFEIVTERSPDNDFSLVLLH